MATKKTDQDQSGTSQETADVTQGDTNQSAIVAPAAATPQTGSTIESEQPGDPIAPVAPATDSPGTPIADASASSGDVTGTPELPGYVVTDVSSVLHDGTWYHQGDEISLNDKEATPLLRRRIIEPSRSKK